MSSLRSAVHQAAIKFPGGIEAIAGALSAPDHKVNAQILRNQLIGNERHNLDIGRAEIIMDLCNSDALAHAAAQQRGGVFVKLPAEDELPASDLAVLELVTQIWRANGDVGRAIDEILADHRVEKSELPKIRSAVNKEITALQAVLVRLEGMAE